MNILRRLGVFLACILLPLALWGFAIDVGLVKTFGDSQNVKKIVANSGIYDSIVQSALKEAASEASSSGDEIPINNEIVQSSVQEAFTPQLLKQNTETVIDGVYSWLEGKTEQPNFNIDLSDAKANFAQIVSQKIAQRLASLPACPPVTTQQEFDPYNATCLPKGLTPQVAAQQVKDEIANNQEFLQDPTISANEIKGNCSDQGPQACKNEPSIFAGDLKKAPDFYQKFKTSPIVLAILAVLAATAVIFLSSSRRKGLRRVGITLLIIGGLLLIFAYGASNQAANRNINLDNKVLQDNVRTLITDVAASIGKTYYIIGGVYFGLGLVAVLLPSIAGGKGSKKTDLEGEGRTAEDRIDLKEPDKAESFTEDKEDKPEKTSKTAADNLHGTKAQPVSQPRPKTKPEKSKPKPTVRKIKIQ